MKILKVGGKAGIVIKNTFLSNSDNAAISLRKELKPSFNFILFICSTCYLRVLLVFRIQ